MARRTINDKVNNLPDDLKQKIRGLVLKGESIVDISAKFNLEYDIVQAYLWQSGTLPLRGAKRFITIRLNRFGRATKQPDREQIAEEIDDKVEYLYFVAKNALSELKEVKRSLTRLERSIRST